MKYSMPFILCSQYLENYLWMNYSPEVSSKAYLMSICCMVNEKFRENVPAWEVTDLNYFIAFLLSSLKLLHSSFFTDNIFRTEKYFYPKIK